jgi:hypothetical protein
MLNHVSPIGTISGTLFAIIQLPVETPLYITSYHALVAAFVSFVGTIIMKKIYNYFAKEKI